MATRRANPMRVKQNYSYSVSELAACLDVHANTIRHWQRDGLEPVDSCKPTLFHGAAVKQFLTKRNANRKRPCPPGMIYCFRCREPRAPAPGMVEYIPLRADGGNLKALCGCCGAIMHRRVRKDQIAAIMPGCVVQMREGQTRLIGTLSPSLNCDNQRNR